MRDALSPRQINTLFRIANAEKWLRVAQNDKNDQAIKQWEEKAEALQQEFKSK